MGWWVPLWAAWSIEDRDCFSQFMNIELVNWKFNHEFVGFAGITIVWFLALSSLWASGLSYVLIGLLSHFARDMPKYGYALYSRSQFFQRWTIISSPRLLFLVLIWSACIQAASLPLHIFLTSYNMSSQSGTEIGTPFAQTGCLNSAFCIHPALICLMHVG